MPQSMTGFGRGHFEAQGRELTVEIRSVNHRYCDIRVNLPADLSRFSGGLERELRGRFVRGRLEVQVSTLRRSEGAAAPQIDGDLARSYLNAYRQVAEELGLEGQIDLRFVLEAPGVVSGPEVDEEEGVLQEVLMGAFESGAERARTDAADRGRAPDPSGR